MLPLIILGARRAKENYYSSTHIFNLLSHFSFCLLYELSFKWNHLMFHTLMKLLLPYRRVLPKLLWSYWKRPWCWERLRARGERGNRRWDGGMASLTRWTWVDQTQGDSEGQGSLACCSSWSCKELDISEWLNSNYNQQNHLLETQIPTLGHLKLLCHWAVQGLMFLGLMYSVLDLITSFLCNTCQIVCTFFQESNRKLPNFSLTFYFCFRAFRSVTFCTSFYYFTSCPATCMSLSFFQLLMPLCCTSRSFSTPHPQYFFGWSISELQLSFVCIFLWLNVYGHYHKNSYSITISTPSLGRKTSAAFLILLACLMAIQPSEEGAPPTTRLFILLGKPYIAERPKSAKKKKKGLHPPSSVLHG